MDRPDLVVRTTSAVGTSLGERLPVGVEPSRAGEVRASGPARGTTFENRSSGYQEVMEYRHRSDVATVRRDRRRPGPWAQLPWRILGMLFIAALMVLSQQHRTSLGPDDRPAPASDTPAQHAGTR